MNLLHSLINDNYNDFISFSSKIIKLDENITWKIMTTICAEGDKYSKYLVIILPMITDFHLLSLFEKICKKLNDSSHCHLLINERINNFYYSSV